MANIKKHAIKKIKKSTGFCKAGRKILKQKLKNVIKLINAFLIDDSVENLHSMRIGIRRFRYVMEIFYFCFEPKSYQYVYNKAKELQDFVGEGRDLDVLGDKIKLVEDEENIKIPENFFSRINEERIKVRQLIKVELIKFIENKEVNNFLTKTK